MNGPRPALLTLLLALVAVPSTALGTEGRWSRVCPPSSFPEGQFDYDPLRDRTLVVLSSPEPTIDLWFRSVADGGWTRVRVPGAPFSAGESRILHDAPRDRYLALVARRNEPFAVWTIEAGTPTAWKLLAGTGSPIGRVRCAVARDSGEDRWLVFGGVHPLSNEATNELWELTVDATTARWSPIAPTSGTVSERRSNSSAAYDTRTRRLFVLGGMIHHENGGTLDATQDVYQVDLSLGAEWSLISRDVWLSNSTSRTQAIVDETGRRLLVFGSSRDTIRAISLEGMPVLGFLDPPLPGEPFGLRYVHVAAKADGRTFLAFESTAHITASFAHPQFDPANESRFDREIGTTFSPFVGRHPGLSKPILIEPYPFPFRNVSPTGSVWWLDDREPGVWRQLEVAGSPPPSLRWHGGSSLDTRRGRWILLQPDSVTGTCDAWAVEFGPPARWIRLATTGTPPGFEGLGAAVYDPIGDRLLVLPAPPVAASPLPGEVWSLALGDGNRWSRIESVGPVPTGRSEPLLALDPRTGRLLRYGGWVRWRSLGGIGLPDQGRATSSLWAITLDDGVARWDSVAVDGDSLTIRSTGTFEFDAGRGSFLIAGADRREPSNTFGGIAGFQLFELTPGPTRWTSRSLGTPVERGYYNAERSVLIPERDRFYVIPQDARGTRMLVRDQPSRTLLADVDLEPGNGQGRGAGGNGNAPVTAALLSDASFDVSLPSIVDVTLNDVAGSALSGGRGRRDADGDGRADAWFSFERRELGLTSGESSFEVRARTADGVTLVGFDRAEVVGRQSVGMGLHVVSAVEGLAFGVRAESPSRRDGVLHLSLPEARDVTVEVFSVDGRRVSSVGPLAFGAGRHRVGLPGVERLTSGVYWARLRAGADTWSGRIVRVD